MKILVAGPETNDCLTHNIIGSLRRMGHEVRGLEYNQAALFQSPLGRGADLLLEKSVKRWRLRLDLQLVKISREFQPKLIIAGTRTLEPEIVLDLQRAGALVVCWYTDPAGNLKRNHIVGGEYDAVFLKDLQYANRLRDLLGVRAYHLDEACNADWHRPVAGRANDSVAVMGSLYGFRERFVEGVATAGFDVRIYGTGPSVWTKPAVKALHAGVYLDETNKARVLGGAMASINTFANLEGDSLNCRIFESCGCGAALVSEKRPAMDRCFDEGEEYLSFATMEQCVEALRRLDSDTDLSKRLRARASARAHAHHTYDHRMAVILRTLDME